MFMSLVLSVKRKSGIPLFWYTFLNVNFFFLAYEMTSLLYNLNPHFVQLLNHFFVIYLHVQSSKRTIPASMSEKICGYPQQTCKVLWFYATCYSNYLSQILWFNINTFSPKIQYIVVEQVMLEVDFNLESCYLYFTYGNCVIAVWVTNKNYFVL